MDSNTMVALNKSISVSALLKRALSPKRFSKDERGVTAIEFGLLALPFFTIIGAIIETSLIFLASQVLDSAVHDSSRFIKTGQAHTANYTLANYRVAICDKLFGLFDCNAVQIRVREIANFSSATLVPVTNPADGVWTVVEQYDHGSSASIIMIEAYYKWPIVLNTFDFNLSNLPDNTRLLSSVRLFRNEPF